MVARTHPTPARRGRAAIALAARTARRAARTPDASKQSARTQPPTDPQTTRDACSRLRQLVGNDLPDFRSRSRETSVRTLRSSATNGDATDVETWNGAGF